MDGFDLEIVDATFDVDKHVKAIKDIAAGVSDPVHSWALLMLGVHRLMDLPVDDPVAYEAIEKVYLHFHNMEGKDNGTN